MLASCTKRRFQCRRFGHGSGWIRSIRTSDCGGANTSDARRFAFSCAYCWGWMRQQENLQLGIPHETIRRFPRRLQELCGYSVYKGQFGHIDNHDPIELLGRERGKRMVWEATDARKARMGEAVKG